jgi:very-short-patch-repair endonuclease
MVPLDAALHAGRCSLDEVSAALVGPSRSTRLRARAEQLLARADPACESVGETRTRLLLMDVGFAVRSQVEVREGARLVGRVDFLVGDKVVVEFDGALKYGGVEGRAALVAEKRREDALRSLGYTVVRVTWADLADPAPVVARIRRALSGSYARGADVPAS